MQSIGQQCPTMRNAVSSHAVASARAIIMAASSSYPRRNLEAGQLAPPRQVPADRLFEQRIAPAVAAAAAQQRTAPDAAPQQDPLEPQPSFDHAVKLSIPSDQTYLDPVHNFLRSNCIDIFVATKNDMTSPGRGSRPSRVGQVGLRCAHCKDAPRQDVIRQAVCFPSKRNTIFESVRNFRRVHFEACSHIPDEMKAEYKNLVQQESPLKKPQKMIKAYYAEAAAELGLVDTPTGLIFGAPPNTTAMPSERLRALIKASESPTKFALFWEAQSYGKDDALKMKKFEHVASYGTRQVIMNARKEPSTFVYPQDFPTISNVDYLVYHQVTCCRPTATRLDQDSSTSGLCCKHCARAHAGDSDSYIRGIYFPTDLPMLSDSSFTQTLLNHIMGCPNVPQDIKDALEELKRLAIEYGITTKRGSKKNFFKKIWARIEKYYE